MKTSKIFNLVLIGVFTVAVVLAGCGSTVQGKAVSIFEDPFKVAGLQAVDGTSGLRPDAEKPTREVTYGDGGKDDEIAVQSGAGMLIHEAAVKNNVPAGDNPWDGGGLEWFTSSPPPHHNFTHLPPIRSERPTWDYNHPEHRKDESHGDKRHREHEEKTTVGAPS